MRHQAYLGVNLSDGLPRISLPETVWKVLGGRDGCLRSLPWRARDTPRIFPTTNGAVSARICPSTRDKEAPGFTAYKGDPRCRLLRAQERLPLAVAAQVGSAICLSTPKVWCSKL